MACGDIETLERRTLLSGNVTTSFRAGDLTLSGDSRDNQVRIARRSSTTTRVTGLEGTRINGRSFVDFTGPLDDLTVSMRQGGEDQVQLQGPLTIAGDLEGAIGDGELIVEGSAGRVQINGDLDLAAEDGDVKLRNDVVVNGETDLQARGAVTAASNVGIVPNFAAARFTHPLDIDNPYFPLVPGTTYRYEERSIDDETGEEVVESDVVEVTNQTKTILGVRVRVVRDRVFVDGRLEEDTFDWHAQDDSGNVWYFGEDTTSFEYDDEGNLVATHTGGSWQAGVDGAQAGILMMARPRVGNEYHQEFAPGDVLDEAKVLSTNTRIATPAGTFGGAVRTSDSSVIEPDALEHKFYAPGLGLVAENHYDLLTGELDSRFRLLSATRNGRRVTQVVPPTGFSGTNATGRAIGPLRFRGETFVESEETAILRQARFGDEVEITGDEDVIVTDSSLEDLTVRAGGSVGLRNVTATEEVLLRAGGDAFIFDSRFNDDVDIILGAGDNELAIARSRFADLDADGGPGHDTFDDRGGNSFAELELRRFEED